MTIEEYSATLPLFAAMVEYDEIEERQVFCRAAGKDYARREILERERSLSPNCQIRILRIKAL